MASVGASVRRGAQPLAMWRARTRVLDLVGCLDDSPLRGGHLALDVDLLAPRTR